MVPYDSLKLTCEGLFFYNSSVISPVQEKYLSFMDQPIIKSFLKQNGRVFIATEGRSVELISQLCEVGHRHFCEKYIQEAVPKWASLSKRYPDCVLHNFGYLQRNKVKKCVENFDALESVDRESLIETLYKIKKKLPEGRLSQVYLQVKFGNEPQKTGASVDDVPALVEKSRSLGLALCGLMAIPPKYEKPTPYFKQLRKLATQFGLQDCVMGMSQTYEEAIEHGATQIRIAKVLFDA